jgi:hypothetical protein
MLPNCCPTHFATAPTTRRFNSGQPHLPKSLPCSRSRFVPSPGTGDRLPSSPHAQRRGRRPVAEAQRSQAGILGFDNHWQGAGAPQATERALPSGTVIRALSPPYLLATKLEAFKGRGNGDFLGSRDFADIIALVDGREELVDEVAAADQDVRRYVAREVSLLLAAPRIADGLFGAMRADPASQQRAESVVLHALRSIASAS